MKNLLTAILLFVCVNSYSQTTVTAGIGGAYCFSKGNDKGVFKELLISQVNQTFDRLTLSAVTVAINDSVAMGYIGTGISYPVYAKNDKVLLLGFDILKGEKTNAIAGAGITYVKGNTLIGLHWQRDISKGEDWISIAIQRFVF